jgi:hypothetical protein
MTQGVSGDGSPQAYFRLILLTVVGQAFQAAGYTLDERPSQHAAGLFRFVKLLPAGLRAIIEFQLLAYVDTEWSSGAPSRFRVTLIRTDQANPAARTAHPGAARRDLSALVVEDFGVPILSSGGHWWTYRDVTELGRALGEAGHLAIGYGMPWLAGDLTPPAQQP